MVNAVRALGVVVEALGGAGLLALTRAVDGEVRAAPLAAGFATGYLYRQSRATAGCRRFRGGPARSLAVAMAWTALGVALDRSTDDPAASRAFASGLALGSAGYWVARRGE
jgi:hypothetical protein